MWWAFVTLTTVGYGDKFPLSTEGRLIAVVLMTAGVGLFGTFSGFVAAWFLESPARHSAELAAINSLRQEVAGLRDEVRTLRPSGGSGDPGDSGGLLDPLSAPAGPTDAVR